MPSGCVDAAEHRDRVWAAERRTNHEECEGKPDRCFWTDGWDFYRQDRMLEGTCYYSKGKVPKMCSCDQVVVKLVSLAILFAVL